MRPVARRVSFALTFAIFTWQPAVAQVNPANETVADRARPEFDAAGVPFGAFRMFPRVGLGLEHDSNIFADGQTPISDLIYVVSPELQLESNWSTHALDLGANADIARFNDFDGENHVDFRVWMNGRLDINRSSFLRATLRHASLHEGRDSADDRRGLEPTPFDVDSVALSYEMRPGSKRLHARFEGEYDGFDFHDVPGSEGTINNDDRDRQQLRGTMRVGFDALPTNSLYLTASLETTDYDSQFDNDGFERSSRGYEVAVGTALDYSGVTFGEVFVGYLSRAYDDPRYQRIAGFAFGADLAWNVSGLTTVTLSGSRTIEPTTIVNAAGIQATRFRLGVDHELLRNLILSLSWATANEDFRGIDRTDDIETAEFSARYLMNRRAELALGFNHRSRQSTPDDDDLAFSRDIVSLTLEVRL